MNRAASEDARDDRAWVDVDLGAVTRNARRVAAAAGVRLLPMVKANAYGLGAIPIARALEKLDPWGFGVATVEEGVELRDAGIERRILLFTPILPDWITAAARHQLTPVICDLRALRHWLGSYPTHPFHIGIDTGMARAGFPHDDQTALTTARDLIASARGYEGICTHFHSAEDDPPATARQWDRLHAAMTALGPRPLLVHAANSAAALAGRHYAGDLVRPGIFLYGGRVGPVDPEPVAAFRARVVAVRTLRSGETVSYGASWRAPRDTVIATLAAGYADGVPRSVGDTAVVELGGRRCGIRGRVTMDMTLVEAESTCGVGDVATIFGGIITVDEQAEAAGTISYELLTRISGRVERRYS